jgi:hypothetical protein
VRRLALVFSLLAVTGCSHEALSATLTSAQKAWGDCVMAAVMRTDDGHSDPVSVAYGVSPQCA